MRFIIHTFAGAQTLRRVHDYKGLHKYLVLSKQQFEARTPRVMSWARDCRKSSGGHISHSNTLSGCKAWAWIALWQMKDKHGSYSILGSSMTTHQWSGRLSNLPDFFYSFLSSICVHTTKYNIVLPERR